MQDIETLEKVFKDKLDSLVNDISSELVNVKTNERIIMPDLAKKLAAKYNLDYPVCYAILSSQLKIYPTEYGELYVGKKGGWYKGGKQKKVISKEAREAALADLNAKLEKISNDTNKTD